MDDLRLLWDGYTNAECPDCDGIGEIYTKEQVTLECELCNGTGNLDEDIPDLGSLFDYGLSFDYVAPQTFNDQLEGYFRYQLSWGGPSDEFRIYANRISEYDWSIYKIEYWFLDWFDGAKINVTGETFFDELLESFFMDSGTFDHVYNEAIKDL